MERCFRNRHNGFLKKQKKSNEQRRNKSTLTPLIGLKGILVESFDDVIVPYFLSFHGIRIPDLKNFSI